jgi:hypothetical protein
MDYIERDDRDDNRWTSETSSIATQHREQSAGDHRSCDPLLRRITRSNAQGKCHW